VTTMAEPEWDQATRDLVLGYDAVELCAACRRPVHICQDIDRQFDWEAGAPVRCHATTALLEAQKGVTEETNPHVSALMWPVMLRAEKGTDL
jgi:hypothetical protein